MIIHQPQNVIIAMSEPPPPLIIRSTTRERKDSAEFSVNHEDEKKTTEAIQKNKKKKVSFRSGVSMIKTLHHKDYTPKEKSQCWYLRSNFTQWKQEFQPIIERMIAGEPEEEGHCFRGLENRVVERALERRVIRMEARRLIFQKQLELKQQQRRRRRIRCHDSACHDDSDTDSDTDCDDDSGDEEQGLIVGGSKETIPRQVIKLSLYCTFRAHDIGLSDEREASRIMSKPISQNQGTER